MKKMMILITLIIFLVVIGCNNDYQQDDSSPENTALALCLTEHDVTMYGTEWCPHCQNQKKAFGSAFKEINYVDCDKDRNACEQAGVQGYPTWNINGQNYPGEQSLDKLAQLAGCEIE